MYGVVVATHGLLGRALVETALEVVPQQAGVAWIHVTDKDRSNTYEARFRDVVKEIGSGRKGVLVLTDMFGGTPSNVAMMLHAPDAVEMVTGVNLPMIIKVLQQLHRAESLMHLAAEAKASAQRSIVVAGEALATAAPKGRSS